MRSSTSRFWTSVSLSLTLFSFELRKKIKIFWFDHSELSSGNAIQIDIKSTGCLGEENNHIRYLEHVQLFVTIEYSKRGDLHLNLTSPNGTNTMLLSERGGDYSYDGFYNWPFMSVHTWGENPAGVWQIRVNDRVSLIQWYFLWMIFKNINLWI